MRVILVGGLPNELLIIGVVINHLLFFTMMKDYHLERGSNSDLRVLDVGCNYTEPFRCDTSADKT